MKLIAAHTAQGALIGAVTALLIPGDIFLRIACTAAVGLVVGLFISLARRGG